MTELYFKKQRQIDEANLYRVGDIAQSMLTEVQFQDQRDDTWVLMDGQSVTGSDYEAITANSNVPDARGRALRMKDNAAGVNPDGDLALGANQADEFDSHTHTVNNEGCNGAPGTLSNVFVASLGNGSFFGQRTALATGGNETRMKNTTVNYFIKVNEAPTPPT